MRKRPLEFSNFRVRRRSGFRAMSDRDAIKVEGYVYRFAEDHGRGPTAKEFVADALPEDSPTHDQIPHDSEAALYQQQLEAARYRMRGYEYVEIAPAPDKHPITVPGTISFRSEFIVGKAVADDKGDDKEQEMEIYMPGFRVITEDRLAAQHLRDLQEQLIRIRRDLIRFEIAWQGRSEGYRIVIQGIDQIERDEKARKEKPSDDQQAAA